MNENAMRIMVTPTREKVIIGGIEFRVFKGETSSGIPIELMGLFRIVNDVQREQFVRSVCVVDVGDPPPVPLILTPDMVSGVNKERNRG